MRLTKSDVGDYLERLENHFKRPDGDELQQVADYHEALQYFPREIVDAAVRRHIRTEDRFWPKPAALVALCRQGTVSNGGAPASDYAQWLADPFRGPGPKGEGGSAEESRPCPVCGSVWRWLKLERSDGSWTPGRLHVRCDPQRHAEQGSRAVTTYPAGAVVEVEPWPGAPRRDPRELAREVASAREMPPPVSTAEKAAGYRQAAQAEA